MPGIGSVERTRMKIITVISLLTVLCSVEKSWAQTQSGCPALASLATSKKVFDDGSEHIVIWFSNVGTKSILGVQFELLMLDGVGNRYPASQRYVATVHAAYALKPNTGDVVD